MVVDVEHGHLVALRVAQEAPGYVSLKEPGDRRPVGVGMHDAARPARRWPVMRTEEKRRRRCPEPANTLDVALPDGERGQDRVERDA